MSQAGPAPIGPQETRADVTTSESAEHTARSLRPLATYRLQLTAERPFAHAEALVGYLADLG